MIDPDGTRPARPHPGGLAREIYPLLVTFQVLRTAMSDATDAQPAPHLDRASFTVHLIQLSPGGRLPVCCPGAIKVST